MFDEYKGGRTPGTELDLNLNHVLFFSIHAFCVNPVICESLFFNTLNRSIVKMNDSSFSTITEAFVQYAEQIEKSGKPLFAGQHRNDQHVCLAKDFKKYLNRKIVH
jgi:hypothetical protein